MKKRYIIIVLLSMLGSSHVQAGMWDYLKEGYNSVAQKAKETKEKASKAVAKKLKAASRWFDPKEVKKSPTQEPSDSESIQQLPTDIQGDLTSQYQDENSLPPGFGTGNFGTFDTNAAIEDDQYNDQFTIDPNESQNSESSKNLSYDTVESDAKSQEVLTAMQKRVDEKDGKIKELTSQIEQLSKKQGGSDTDELSKKLEALAEENNNLKLAAGDANKKLGELEEYGESNVKIKKDHRQILENYKQLELKNKEMEQEKIDLKLKIDELSSNNKLLEDFNESCGLDLQSRNNETENLTNQFSKEIGSLESRLNQSGIELEAAKTEIEDLEGQIRECYK